MNAHPYIFLKLIPEIDILVQFLVVAMLTVLLGPKQCIIFPMFLVSGQVLMQQQKSRAFYRIQATRMMIGAGNILKKHAADQARKVAQSSFTFGTPDNVAWLSWLVPCYLLPAGGEQQ